jgi:hypothetical protein
MGKRFFAKQHNTDANQPEIIEALKSIGARCYEMEKPVDLLVEFEGMWILLEVKNPKGKNTLTKEQKDFFEITRAPAYVVRSVDQARAAVLDAMRLNKRRNALPL